jgi:diacylglycerol kinase (ATP)
MSTPFPILLNTKAGALHATAGVEQMRQMVEEVGLEAEVIGTRSPREMRQVVRRLVADKAPRVAVAGGDGTVSLVVQELVHSDTVLGIIPQGTFNNFATALRLPMDLPSALRALQDGVVRHIDVGKVDNRYFTEAAGVGLFADALAIYGRGTNKNLLRGLYAVTRVLLSLKAHHMRVVVDGEPNVERAIMCTVSNTYRMWAGMPVAPGARLTDGELDVVIVGDLKPSELIPYYRAFRAQMHLNLPKITTLRAKEVRLEARHHLNVHCDDTTITTTPAIIQVQPGALKVMVDRL